MAIFGPGPHPWSRKAPEEQSFIFLLNLFLDHGKGVKINLQNLSVFVALLVFVKSENYIFLS